MNGYWVKIGLMQCKPCIIKAWLYDTWFEVYCKENNTVYWVEPNCILWNKKTNV